MLTAIGSKRGAVGLLASALLLACANTADDADQTALTVRAAPGAIEEADTRSAIEVDATTRVAVLTEMRTMLKAVQGIVAAAERRDTAALRAAALLGGMQAATETNPVVQEQLGGDFTLIGMRTHAAFDILAADVLKGNENLILRNLAIIMRNCVGCHERWRLTIRQ